ncbi:type 1 glutamine amidotransferase domain-containing protein [Geothrix fermentans]|jgi:putative intracellular protease/amidase|uniref:type 1 glutamine amidotransferase domain-containing protein n=1 Tax=Geothrix fermentans TaxID=44676 RepID=UPI00047D2FCD|nr:type 1 glutamine amidotransferase domain-containing protein [Geothrix fermentans]
MSETLSKPSVLFVLTNAAVIGPNARPTGYEFSEVANPYDEFVRRGWNIDFASPEGGRPPEDGYDASDPVSVAFRKGDGFVRLGKSLVLSEVDPTEYDAVFFPGGLGPMVDMAASPLVKTVIARAYDSGRVVGAVCHGPVALLGVTRANGESLLKGKRVTSFTTAEEEGHSREDVPFMLDDALREEGAIHSHAQPFEGHVVQDGRLVTGQNPASARRVATVIADLVTGDRKHLQR